MAVFVTFDLRRRHALSGWWVFLRVEWGQGSSAGGLGRDIPFRTKLAARSWMAEQFPQAVPQ